MSQAEATVSPAKTALNVPAASVLVMARHPSAHKRVPARRTARQGPNVIKYRAAAVPVYRVMIHNLSQIQTRELHPQLAINSSRHLSSTLAERRL